MLRRLCTLEREVNKKLLKIPYRYASSTQPWKDWFDKQSSNDPIHRLLKNKAYLDGEWVDSVDKTTFDVLDPASREVICSVPNMDIEDAKNSINSCHNALKSFRSLTSHARCDIAYKIYVLLLTYKEQLARIITGECGKPYNEALGEVMYSANFFKFFSEEGRRVYGDIIPSNINNRRIHVIKQSVGVVGIITPWNFPLAMIARKLAAAIVSGCTSVIKPAPDTPLSCLALVNICNEAGVEAGVINVITSDVNKSYSIGTELCLNKLIRKISFTGSTNGGINLAQQSATTMKRISMELGGNAPFIVFDDCNVDNAVNGAIVSKYRNSGQTCVCTNRFYVHSKIYDEFLDKFSKKVSELNDNIGHGFNVSTKLGPLINDNQINKVETHVNNAINDNSCQLIIGGKRKVVSGCEEGAFYEGTVLSNVNINSIIHNEETFGPISALFKFSDSEEVINLANSSDMGLASYFYTNDLSKAFKVSESLEFGMVGVNSGLISSELAPFGGIKFSGMGREGSKYGLDDYLNIKYICYDNL